MNRRPRGKVYAVTAPRRLLAATLTGVLCLGLAACSGDDKDDEKKTSSSDLSGFAKELADQDSIRIGVKYDQPGIGFRTPGSPAPTGFDVEIGRIIADDLGIDEDNITWVEAVSESREELLEGGSFDIVIASYSITDDRRELVGQAGPYLLSGQQLLVRRADEKTITGPDKIKGVRVCSVKGSTSLSRARDDYGAKTVGEQTYSECEKRLRDEDVDAVTTDGAILQGYAAERPNQLRVVGEPFSEERYGIGYPKDAEGMCDFLNASLEKAFEDGSWAKAYDDTLGKSGDLAPDPPPLDDCA